MEPEPASPPGDLESLMDTLAAEVESHPDEAEVPAAAVELPEGLYVTFALGSSRYAVSFANVVEVGAVPPLAPVPNTPPWVLGVANLRGEILSVVDLAGLLGLTPSELPAGARLLVVRTASEPITTGLVVDRVAGMSTLAPTALAQPTAPLEDPVVAYLVGVAPGGEALINVLDLDKLLASPRFRV